LLEEDELRRLRKKRLAFVLPTWTHGGGTRVVLTEARYLRSLGVDCWIINLEELRTGFDALLTADDVPTMYVLDYQSVRFFASEFDVVVATAWSSTQTLTALAALERPPTLAYYIQDYEPYFYANDSDENRAARASYHLPVGSLLLTKTRWNQQEVHRHEGVRPTVIGPSYDPAEFNLDHRVHRDTVVRICAMVRPETPRRAPELTMRVLKALKRRFSERVHISVFGCTADALASAEIDTDFEFEHAGILDGRQVAQLLRRNDIFLDFSTFQAMGLTAMEAMACGVTVIGPERGGLREIIEHGISGLLVDTLDEQACIAAASKLIADPPSIDRLAIAGVASVVRFTPERAAAYLARLLLLERNVAGALDPRPT
jgi:glycosyltransferase involved in cell wall biosynthesis